MMARSPFGKGNVDAARQFLAETQAQHPELKGRKSPGEMQPKQVIRQANSFYRQQQEGLAPSKRLARGHANTPERPGARHTKLAPEYARATAGYQMPASVTRQNFKNGNYAIDGVRNKEALAAVRAIGRRGQAVQAVVVETEGEGFKTLSLAQQELQDRLEAGESLDDILSDALAEGYGEASEGGYAPVAGGAVRFLVQA
jgi:hypothetical protein